MIPTPKIEFEPDQLATLLAILSQPAITCITVDCRHYAGGFNNSCCMIAKNIFLRKGACGCYEPKKSKPKK